MSGAQIWNGRVWEPRLLVSPTGAQVDPRWYELCRTCAGPRDAHVPSEGATAGHCRCCDDPPPVRAGTPLRGTQGAAKGACLCFEFRSHPIARLREALDQHREAFKIIVGIAGRLSVEDVSCGPDCASRKCDLDAVFGGSCGCPEADHGVPGMGLSHAFVPAPCDCRP